MTATPCKCLVDGVIHDLVYEMVKTAQRRGTNIHAGTATDCLQAFQNQGSGAEAEQFIREVSKYLAGSFARIIAIN